MVTQQTTPVEKMWRGQPRWRRGRWQTAEKTILKTKAPAIWWAGQAATHSLSEEWVVLHGQDRHRNDVQCLVRLSTESTDDCLNPSSCFQQEKHQNSCTLPVQQQKADSWWLAGKLSEAFSRIRLFFRRSWSGPLMESPYVTHPDYNRTRKFQWGTCRNDAMGLTTVSKKHLATDQAAVFDMLGVETGWVWRACVQSLWCVCLH